MQIQKNLTKKTEYSLNTYKNQYSKLHSLKNRDQNLRVGCQQMQFPQNSQNSSFFEGKFKNNLNPSISQKIIEYTNELKSYLLYRIQNYPKPSNSQFKNFEEKMRTQSSKNVKKQIYSKPKLKPNNKSLKYLRPQTQSQSDQCLIIKNLEAKRKQQNFVQQKLTSLSKVLQNTPTTEKVISQQQKYSYQKMNDFQNRISNLEVLVKRLVYEDSNRYQSQKENQHQNLKETQKKSIIRRKPMQSVDKKKSQPLKISQDKQAELRTTNIKQRIDLPKSPFKRIDQNKLESSFKQAAKPLFGSKKPTLKLSASYQPMIQSQKKNSKRVILNKSPFENLDCRASQQVAFKK